MFHIVLYEPEIPPNTGNIMRLARNTGCTLHLVEPLGFAIDDRRMRRAGLDYADWESVQCHPSWTDYLEKTPGAKRLTYSTRNPRNYTEMPHSAGDHLIFGPETRGLPDQIRESVPPEHRLRLPMGKASRSLNLSNSVAIAVYEAWRQQAFQGAQ